MNGSAAEMKSNKSALTALLLCMFLGLVGAHRFYVGKVKTGLLMLLTLGGVGIWVLVDLICIIRGHFRDKADHRLLFASGCDSVWKCLLMMVGSVVATLLVFVAVLLAVVMSVTSPMVDVIQQQLSALRAGDIDKAYSFMADETKSTVSINEFKRYMSSYPIMTTNLKASFPERKIEDGQGYAIGVLTLNDGAKASVEYRLVKENNVWKVLALRVGKIEASSSANKAEGGLNVFEDKENHFSINYPSDWSYEQPERYSVLFSGKEGSPAYYSTVSIQVIATKSAGGMYKNANEAIHDIEKQIKAQTTQAKFIDEGKAALPSNAKKFKGEYFVATYSYQDTQMKKMQYIIANDDGQTLYSWGFTAPADRYDIDLPTAKAMFESWLIQ